MKNEKWKMNLLRDWLSSPLARLLPLAGVMYNASSHNVKNSWLLVY